MVLRRRLALWPAGWQNNDLSDLLQNGGDVADPEHVANDYMVGRSTSVREKPDFVILNHDGTVRIERGFVRAEDEKPEPEAHDVSGEGEGGDTVNEDGGTVRGGEAGDESLDGEDGDADDHKPLSDILIRDLTAHRTLGLRLALSEQPEVAIVAVTHALSAQIFYRSADARVLDIRPASTMLAAHADGIDDAKAGKAWSDHHANWAAQMPRDVSGLWKFIVELDHDSRMALFAHCTALTVD